MDTLIGGGSFGSGYLSVCRLNGRRKIKSGDWGKLTTFESSENLLTARTQKLGSAQKLGLIRAGSWLLMSGGSAHVHII